jgi:hypothetical protein
MANKLSRFEESTRELYLLLQHRILTCLYCELVPSLRTAEQLMDKCETNSKFANVTQTPASSLYSQLFTLFSLESVFILHFRLFVNILSSRFFKDKIKTNYVWITFTHIRPRGQPIIN